MSNKSSDWAGKFWSVPYPNPKLIIKITKGKLQHEMVAELCYDREAGVHRRILSCKL